MQLNDYPLDGNLHELQSLQMRYFTALRLLLSVTTNIMLSLDMGERVFLLLLDLLAASDTVNHSLLHVLSQLKKAFGITELFFDG